MKVIICGAGQVGSNIARHLAQQKNDVTVIDQSPKLIRKIADTLDVQAIEGHASDPDVLELAGASGADMIIAVTLSDEVNMISCQVAHSLFDVPVKIARIRNQAFLKPTWQDLFSRENLPIDVIISPEVEVARAVERRLEVPGAFEVISFCEGRVRVVGTLLKESCPVVDTPLRQLTELFPDLHITVLGIIRDDKMFLPRPQDMMEVGDSIYFAVEDQLLSRAMAVFGHEEKEARRLVIVGGGNVGLYLAQNLEETRADLSIKLIEADEERASYVAGKLDRTVVLCGDGLDTEILKEANTDNAETIIAVADDDEVNILSSLLAKRMGALRAIALISNPIYGTLIGSLGIDVYVDPRETTVSTIIQHIRRGRIRSLFSIRSGEAEIIEAEAMETSPVVGKAVRDLNLPDGILLGAVHRGDEVLMPRGGTILEAGDRVVIFALSKAVKKVEQLFAVRLEFF